MQLKQILLHETKLFLKNNNWVFFVFLLSISLIVYSNTWNFWDIVLIFIIDVIGNIFTMVMNSCYGDKKISEWSFFLFASVAIYTAMWIYNLIVHGQPHYLIAEIAFFLWWLKRFLEDTKWKKKFNFLGIKTVVIVNIIWLIWLYFLVKNSEILNYSAMITFIWLAVISSFLVLEDLKIKYYGSTFGMALLTIGPSIAVYYWILNKNILGIDLSYALFSFACLISFLKDWNKFKAM